MESFVTEHRTVSWCLTTLERDATQNPISSGLGPFPGSDGHLPLYRWLDSRIFIPLDYAVSLDDRHLRSPPFAINLKETYFAFLDLDDSLDDWNEANRCNYKIIMYPQWRVYRLGSATLQSRELW